MGILFRILIVLATAILLFSIYFAHHSPAVAAVLSPEGKPPEEGKPAAETVTEPESAPLPENPFGKPAQHDPSEAIRKKRERTTILIIVGVVVLLCAYWLTSGKLHHRFPG